MPITGPDYRLYVVVGVLRNSRNQFLIQQRLQGKPCAGQWEFPGGKLEENEDPIEGLARELDEELGITIANCLPLIQIAHDYDHANVWLDVYFIDNFLGGARSQEGQKFEWKTLDQIYEMDVLEAVPPILEAVAELKTGSGNIARRWTRIPNFRG